MEFVRFMNCPTCLDDAFVVYIAVHSGAPESAVHAEGHCLECGEPAKVTLTRCPICQADGAIQAGEAVGATYSCPEGCQFPLVSRTEVAGAVA